MKRILLILSLILPLFVQAQVINSQPQIFNKYVRVKGSLFSDSAMLNSDSSNRVPNTGWAKRVFAPLTGGGYIPNTRQVLNGFGILGGTQLNVDITKSVDSTKLLTINRYKYVSDTLYNKRFDTIGVKYIYPDVAHTAFNYMLTGDGSTTTLNAPGTIRFQTANGSSVGISNSIGFFSGVTSRFTNVALGTTASKIAMLNVSNGIMEYLPGNSYLTPSDASAAYQPLNTKLTSIGGLANGVGALTNNGSGVFSYNSYKLFSDSTANTGYATRYSTNRFYGETWYALGDSFTAMNLYQSYLTGRIGVTITSNGVPASAVAMGVGTVGSSFVERMPAAISAGKNRIIMVTWDNDLVLGVPLGTISSTSDSTYYGALKHIASLAFAANQKMIWVTGGQRGTSTALYASQKIYNDAMLEVANQYGIPVVDAFDGSGLNYTTNSTNTSDGVHLNATGQPIFGNFLASSILSQVTSVPSFVLPLGANVKTALSVNIGSAGAPILFNGAGGTPSSMVGTNITGTAAGLSIGGSAPTLTTTRSIWGQSFNGSSNVSGAMTGVTTIAATGNVSITNNGSNGALGVTITNGNSGNLASAQNIFNVQNGIARIYATSGAYVIANLSNSLLYQNDITGGDHIWLTGASEKMRLSNAGVLSLVNAPSTSAGTFKLLTRDATSGNIEVTTSLPSVTTATTQSAGDNSTKVATTAYADIAKVNNILTKTANYTVLTTDWVAGKNNVLDIYVDATAGSVSITLPSPASISGYIINITKKDASANTISLVPSALAVYGTNLTLALQYQSIQINSDGSTGWYQH